MSYEKALLERAQVEIALPQRFKQNWHKLCSTVKLAMQLLATNYLVGSLPRPIAFLPLLIYLTVISILFYLIIGKDGKNQEDLDMVDVINYRQKYMKRNWYTVLFLILMWAFLLAIFAANYKELTF